MEKISPNKCADCGKTRSNVASITQWIMLGDKCSCGSTSVKRNSEATSTQPVSQRNKICTRCGGSLSKQNGSLTQWVFRIAPCKCNDGAVTPGIASQAGNQTEIELAEDYPEIETEAGRFPIDRYGPLALIGSGEQGEVYKAKDRLLGRLVCVKILRTAKLLPEEAVRFQKEAKAGAKLAHPNLTTVLDFGLTEEGQPFLVMELCSGTSLSDIIKELGGLPVNRALKIFCQLCDGMQYAHDHGILHRDLKTTNILISEITTEFPQVKIIDFGLSGVALDTVDDTSKITHSGLLMGTPAYMSPEQVQEQKIDERSDLYSLGCVIFETLTGKPVFETDTTVDLLNMQVNAAAPSLSAISQKEFPDELELVVSRLLQKDPRARFQTMEELQSTLVDLLSQNLPDPNSAAIEVLEEDGALQLFGSDYGLYSAAAAEAADAISRKKLKRKVVIAVSVLALMVGGILVVSPMMSNNSPKVETALFNTQLALAEGSWDVLSGSVHGENAKKLEQFKNITHIKIIDPEFSDSDLVYLANWPLVVLDLGGTKITNRGVKTISKIKSLQGLLIDNNKNISDAGMNSLKRLRKLRVLSVKGTNVTDRGVSVLASNPSLTSVDLSDLKGVTVESLHALKKLPDLVSLRIENTSITPDDLSVLQDCKSLAGLSVARLGLTDEDMPKLKALTTVNLIDVSGNKKITANGIRALDPLKYWQVKFADCGLSPAEKADFDDKIILSQETPISVAVDVMSPAPTAGTKEIDRELYSFWYSPKYADPAYFKELQKAYFKQR